MKKIIATVLRDTAEKPGFGWQFGPCDWCAGTAVENLNTGDYALRWADPLGRPVDGRILIERKRSTGELATNVFEPRFEDVLARLSTDTDHAYVVCEFPFSDIPQFPYRSGIPPARHKKLRVTGPLLLKRVVELSLDYPRVRWWWTDGPRHAEALVRSLFKRVVERARSAAAERAL